jgi:CheY-like chemotaxis protein
VKVDVDIEAFRKREDARDLSMRIAVGIGTSADQIGARFARSNQQFLRAGIVEQAFLGKDANLKVDRPSVIPFQAADGVETVNLFKSHTHEITFVLLDLTMHKLDGATTLAELRRLKPNVKAVLTSGYNEASLHQRSVQEGFVAFIPKPYQAASLIELARQICAGEL